MLIKVELRTEFVETNTFKILLLKEWPMRLMPIDFFFGDEIELNAWIEQRNRSASVHLLCSFLMPELNTSMLCNTVGEEFVKCFFS